MMENSSFDRNLGCLQSHVKADKGIDGVNPQKPRGLRDLQGNVFQQVPGATNAFDVPHHHVSMRRARKRLGRRRGHVIAAQLGPPATNKPEELAEVMKYFDYGVLPATHALAMEFGICDRFFASVAGPTWPNRLIAMSGTCKGVLSMPGDEASGTSFLAQIKDFVDAAAVYDQTSIFDCLMEKNVDYRIYSGDVPLAYLLVHEILPTRSAHHSSLKRFFKDCAGPEKDFPPFAWIEPHHMGDKVTSGHPPASETNAEELIASVYNAVRENAALWESSLIVLYYDENGGFYDHVRPPRAVPPSASHAPAFSHLGFRVPCVLISPWVRHGVDHVTYDHTSVLRMICSIFGVGNAGHDLGHRTPRINSLLKSKLWRTTAEGPRKNCIEKVAAGAIGTAILHDRTALLYVHQKRRIRDARQKNNNGLAFVMGEFAHFEERRPKNRNSASEYSDTSIPSDLFFTSQGECISEFDSAHVSPRIRPRRPLSPHVVAEAARSDPTHVVARGQKGTRASDGLAASAVIPPVSRRRRKANKPLPALPPLVPVSADSSDTSSEVIPERVKRRLGAIDEGEGGLLERRAQQNGRVGPAPLDPSRPGYRLRGSSELSENADMSVTYGRKSITGLLYGTQPLGGTGMIGTPSSVRTGHPNTDTSFGSEDSGLSEYSKNDGWGDDDDDSGLDAWHQS